MKMHQFLGLPNAPEKQAEVLILPVAYGDTVTYRPGTSAGPQAILAASGQLEFFEEDARWCPFEYLKLCVLDEVHKKPDESAAEFHRRLNETVAVLPADNLFVGLGGEHSITPDMLFARMPDGGTVVQIDAHADLREQYHGSIYNHACPMHRIHEKGYDLIQVSIRSLHAKEAALIEASQNITTYFDRALQQPANWNKLIDQLESLRGPVWLTIDMDGFDAALIGGVGTPQPGGLQWHQGVNLIETLIFNQQIDLRGVDILELLPEENHVSDMMAAKLVQKVISFWGKSKGFDKKDKHGSQIGIDDE